MAEDLHFRRWAEERDREFREWTEERERRHREWVEERERKHSEWVEEHDREHRAFFDALTERHVGITQHLIEAIDSGFSRLQAEIADQRAQIQTNTEALLKVLDRLEPEQG